MAAPLVGRSGRAHVKHSGLRSADDMAGWPTRESRAEHGNAADLPSAEFTKGRR